MVRAVVTGVGCITPIGHNVPEFWSNLTAGVSGVKAITLFDASDQDCRIAAEVKNWDPTGFMEAKAAKRAARFSQFAVAAAKQAVGDSGLAITDANRDDLAVVMNTGGGGVRGGHLCLRGCQAAAGSRGDGGCDRRRRGSKHHPSLYRSDGQYARSLDTK